MASWDVFHSDRREEERSLSTAALRAAVDRGALQPETDLVRPAGSSTPWMRLVELLAVLEPVPPPPGPQLSEPFARSVDEADLEPERFPDREPEGPVDPETEDEEVAAFSLVPSEAGHMDELDLAAMVDVAMQMILFFLVTATTIYFKALEVPKPNPETPPDQVIQQARSLDDLQRDFILVQIDSAGVMRVDRQPVAANFAELAERFRSAREQTGRRKLLLMSDYATPHRFVVLVLDAVNEVGLEISLARPSPSGTARGST